MKERVLVLGGSYFVGKCIVEYLVKKGYEVSVLNRGTKPLSVNGVKQIIADRNSVADMKEALKDKKFDYVIDVSWQDLNWVKNTCETLDFTSVKKFIFISSSAVYDVEKLTIPYNEKDTLGENQYWTFYGKGKIDAESYYENYIKDFTANLIILRPPYIYGAYNYAQRESLIFRQLTEHKPVAIPQSNPKLQFLYTEDLADIVETLFYKDLPKIFIANVGNKRAVTSREWVEACGKVAEIEPEIVEVDYKSLGRGVREFYPFFDYDNVLSTTIMDKYWSKETSFYEGLRVSYSWFKENKENIVFKANVDKSLYEIIAELSV